MAMGLQDLVMFRDNLQQPEMSGMDNLRNLQALTMQSMGSQDYISDPNTMMMNTGLMGLPVAQAGFGGFIKSITKPFKAVGKGITGAVKGVAKGVRNIAKSPIGRIALPLALGYFAGPLAGSLLGKASLLNKALIVGGGTGLGSLVAGDDPEDALRSGVKAGGLYYAGGKLFGPSGGAAGKTAKDISVAQAGDVAKVAADPALLSYGDVGAQQVAGLGLQGAPVGSEFAGGLTGVNVAGTGVDPSVFSSYQQAAPVIPTSSYTGGAMIGQPDIAQAVYPGSGVGGGSTPVIQDKVLTDRTIGQKIADSLPGSGVDEAGTLLTREIPGLDKVASLIPESKLGKAALGVGALSLLGGQQPVQQFTPQQLSSAGITTDFDGQRVVYRNADGEEIDYQTALQMIQQASQSFGPGGERKASGVRLGFERVNPESGSQPLGSVEELGKFAVDNLQQPLLGSQLGGMIDPVLSASGGLIGMSYGGQMPMNNMDVKYKEFSGMVGGRGDGMEDNVYMPIVEGEQGQQVATLAVSPKEYVVDANTMSLLGNGNPDEGAEIMDETVKDIRMAATGQKKQQKEIDGLAALNRMRSV